MKHDTEADRIDKYLKRLFPIPRSLTGQGNRDTFRILEEIIPLNLIEYPSGTPVYDWIIPDEWIIRDAYIKAPDGKRLIDFCKCNLHVVGYSAPVNRKMKFSELAPRLHMLRDSPDAVPYRTSYYNRDWGFCVTKKQYKELEDISGLLEVCIDSEFDTNGSMVIGEFIVSGETKEEFLVSTYCCHPSMANDNLSGLLATAFLAHELIDTRVPRCSWRFIFVPETIGAIAYLCHNETKMKKLLGGLVLTTCGGPGPFGFKESFLGDHVVDRAIRLAFKQRGIDPLHYPFIPDGSDERQYSSPGFRIPVASVTRDKYYEYPEYHTSLDNLSFVNGAQIAESLAVYRDVMRILDQNSCYKSTAPFGEPQLGRRGLYPSTGGGINQARVFGTAEESKLDAITWLLFLADGENDLLSVAERSGLNFCDLVQVSDQLVQSGLLETMTN